MPPATILKAPPSTRAKKQKKKAKLARGVKGTEDDPALQTEEYKALLAHITVVENVWHFPARGRNAAAIADPDAADWCKVKTEFYDKAKGEVRFKYHWNQDSRSSQTVMKYGVFHLKDMCRWSHVVDIDTYLA